jgi:hypothetical protein
VEIKPALLIKDLNDLETHWNRKSDFTGSLTRISICRSGGSCTDISVIDFLPFRSIVRFGEHELVRGGPEKPLFVSFYRILILSQAAIN